MSSRREAARTNETTPSQGLRRNDELEGIANLADSMGLDIEQFILDTATLRSDKDDMFLQKKALGDAKTPLDVLKRTLSVRSVISTNSSFAEYMDAARNADPGTLMLVEIGRGSFGTIYELPGTAWCLKKTLTSPNLLWDEFMHGRKVSEGINDTAHKAIKVCEDLRGILLPRVPHYLCAFGMSESESTEAWFKEHGHKFPVENGGQEPGPIICLERILPLPKIIRENLIRLYFKPELQAEALADKKNKACLCRPYLGCTSTEITADKRERECQSLQNFPLYLDLLEQLDMDPFSIARDMAAGLAAGHWAAQCNMLDVEYVIGSRPHKTISDDEAFVSKDDVKAWQSKSSKRVRNMMTSRSKTQGLSFRNRAIQLWIIDFNKVTKFDATAKQDYSKTIRQIVFDARATDGPYYPRALARTEGEWKLWLEFAKTYIRVSREVISNLFQAAKGAGASISEENDLLMMKRPSLIISEWMNAEATEYGVSSKQFLAKLKDNGWEMP